MPENARRSDAGLFDQFEDEHPIADWGGDDLFTRMPRPRPVDDAPAPRFRPSLAASDPAPPPPRRALTLVEPAEDRPAEEPQASRSGDEAMRERAERLGIALVEPAHRFDDSGSLIEPAPTGRPTKVITGRPGESPRPLPVVRTERRRPPRTPAEWVGARPERIMAWAFALGLLLILIAITTADAATV